MAPSYSYQDKTCHIETETEKLKLSATCRHTVKSTMASKFSAKDEALIHIKIKI